jgi:O-antigen ligase
VYPRYIDDYDRVRSSGYAHNDWIENGTETGLLGLSLILLGFGTYIVRLMRIWYRRRDFHALGIGAGIVAGLLSIGMHSFVDFNMHIPANPLTLAALLAVGYAAVCRKGHGYSESFFYRKREIERGVACLRIWRLLGWKTLYCRVTLPQ